MVSIRESLTELERACELQSTLLECYSSAIRSMEQYAVEIDDEITPPHRRHLAAIQADLAPQSSLEQLTATRSLLRNELRDYRDRAAAFLAALRKELSDKADALQTMVEAMASADGDHEQDLQAAIRRLRAVAVSPAAAPVSAFLTEISNSVQSSIEQLGKQHQLTIGQFMVEIKTLHKRIDSLQAAARKDVLSGMLNRVEMENQLASQVHQGKALCLFALRLCNLPIIQRQFGNAVRNETISAFSKRMNGVLPPNSILGRWSEDRFLAVLPIDKMEAIGLAKRLAQHVTGVYVCMENGKPQRPDLQVNVAVIDHSAGNTYESLIHRLNQL
jgi:GGDEF domain-containing protein